MHLPDLGQRKAGGLLDARVGRHARAPAARRQRLARTALAGAAQAEQRHELAARLEQRRRRGAEGQRDLGETAQRRLPRPLSTSERKRSLSPVRCASSLRDQPRPRRSARPVAGRAQQRIAVCRRCAARAPLPFARRRFHPLAHDSELYCCYLLLNNPIAAV
ncbi:MAG: hypothetical protein WKG00_11475 [Polyangiaceae bacterium]